MTHDNLKCLKGLQYLHEEMKLIHRDIKPCNILLAGDGHVKIGDFGISAKISNAEFQLDQTYVGTKVYMSVSQTSFILDPALI